MFFEKIVQLFYTHVFTAPKETYSKPAQLGVTFASGYLAGVICALVSQPADSIVSQVNQTFQSNVGFNTTLQMGKAENKGKSFGTIAKEVGFTKLATQGLPTRILMVGTLTGKSLHTTGLFHVRCN